MYVNTDSRVDQHGYHVCHMTDSPVDQHGYHHVT